jgi:hypothetical protein
MLMVSILQSEGIESWVELKSKTQPFVAYNNHILVTKTNTGLGLKYGK